MAPTRAKQSSAPSVAGPSKERPRKKSRTKSYSSNPQRSTYEDTLPGVQKLKASLRQTKRLLAKDNLAADVRVETERRLKALEADLAHAEQYRKERQCATKYRKVKFFERQKVIRKINQTKRSIASSEGKEKRKFEATLADLRVDLNYVLHFPKTRKYVSLFPPEVRMTGMTATAIAASSDDNEERSKVREMIRQQMEHGELNTEPEKELGKLGSERKQLVSERRAEASPSIEAPHRTDGVASDDFFGDDDEEDTEQSEDSES